MTTPVKEGFNHFKETCVFTPTPREEELLSRTAHPEDLARAFASIERLRCRIATLEERFNALCQMLSVQLANSNFVLLKIVEDKK